jgi:hypothetical protein
VDLVERYLQAVNRWLPRAESDDIVAELREDIEQQIEERESALGRALSDSDVAEILKRRGHPATVAGGYQHKQYLIGPLWFPTYRMVLRLVLGWILPLVFLLIVGPVLFLTKPDHARVILRTAGTFAQAEVFALGWITLVFAILERTPARLPMWSEWDPRRLPKVDGTSAGQRVPRTTAISDVISGIISTAVCVAVIQHGAVQIDMGEAQLTFAPVWRALAVPILMVTVASVPLGWIALVRPLAVWMRSLIRIGLDAASAAIALILLRADRWVSIVISPSPAASAEATRWINFMVGIGLLISIVAVAADALWEGWRFYRSKGLAKVRGGVEGFLL